MPEKKKIIIAEDQDEIRLALKMFLEGEGFEVTAVENGKVAQSVLGIQACDLLITDIRMPLVNGIELTHFAKKRTPSPPVIVMTGFSELTEASEARALGADEFMAKPFKRDDLLAAIHRCLKITPTPEVAQDLDADYCKVSVDDFITGKQIQYTIYIRLSSARYLKVAHQGEDLAVDRIRAYKQKGIHHLYMLREDFQRYLGLNLELSKIAAGTDRIAYDKRLNLIRHTGDLMMQAFHREELEAQAFDYADTYVSSMVKLVTANQQVMSVLSALESHTDWLYAHSLGVSLFSIMIARELSWNSSTTLSKLALAGLLHDIGKKEIDAKTLVKTRLEMNAEEVRLFESHPDRGATILAEIDGFPDEVLSIVRQHHECCDGSGYPSGLEGKAMNPLARVLSLANEFCKYIIKNPQTKLLGPTAALERINRVSEGKFDTAALIALKNLCSKTKIGVGG